MSKNNIDVPAATEHYDTWHKKVEEKLASDLRFVIGPSGVNMRSLVDVAEDCLVMMGSLVELLTLLGLPAEKIVLEATPENINKIIYEHFGYDEDTHHLGKPSN